MLIVGIINSFNPLTAQIEIKGKTPRAELLVAYFQLGYHAKCEILLQRFLFPFELIQLQNSKRTKKSSPKNLYWNQFYTNFPTHSTMTYTGMSTEH